MTLPELESPNWDTRGDAVIDMIVLHYTGMSDADAARGLLCDPEPVLGTYRAALGRKWRDGPDTSPIGAVSAHYLVDADGRVDALVDEEARAWHAGKGSWRGEADLNARSIGIEIVNGGHDHLRRGAPPAYTPKQMNAVTQLVADITSRRAIPPWSVVGHSDVAPDRKSDPGEHFSWRDLASAGVGLSFPVDEKTVGDTILMRPGAAGDRVRLLQRRFAAWGYGLAESGAFDAQTAAVARAFQRRANVRPMDAWRVCDEDALERAFQLAGRARRTRKQPFVGPDAPRDPLLD